VLFTVLFSPGCLKSVYFSLLFKRADQALARTHRIGPVADGALYPLPASWSKLTKPVQAN
jgi:hypothetical protein